MASAAGSSIAEVQAEITEVKQQLHGASEELQLVLQRRLAALQEEKVLLIRQQSGADTHTVLDSSHQLLACQASLQQPFSNTPQAPIPTIAYNTKKCKTTQCI